MNSMLGMLAHVCQKTEHGILGGDVLAPWLRVCRCDRQCWYWPKQGCHQQAEDGQGSQEDFGEEAGGCGSQAELS